MYCLCNEINTQEMGIKKKNISDMGHHDIMANLKTNTAQQQKTEQNVTNIWHELYFKLLNVFCL